MELFHPSSNFWCYRWLRLCHAELYIMITFSFPWNSQRCLATHWIVWLERFYFRSFPRWTQIFFKRSIFQIVCNFNGLQIHSRDALYIYRQSDSQTSILENQRPMDSPAWQDTIYLRILQWKITLSPFVSIVPSLGYYFQRTANCFQLWCKDMKYISNVQIFLYF